MHKVILACVHNAGGSQMAAAFFNQLVDPKKAEGISAGTELGLSVHPEVLSVMQEVGIDLSAAKPQKLTQELASDAYVHPTAEHQQQAMVKFEKSILAMEGFEPGSLAKRLN